jgi:DNA invertase Pin-like site-specific DNA recombinase
MVNKVKRVSAAEIGVLAPNGKTAEQILEILRKYRNSPIWIRKIARESKVPPSTVKRYLEKYLSKFVAISKTKTPVDMEFAMVRLVHDPRELEAE